MFEIVMMAYFYSNWIHASFTLKIARSIYYSLLQARQDTELMAFH